MPRMTAAAFAALLILHSILPAARAHAQAAEPFPVVPLERPAPRRHTWAYLVLAGGAGLVGLSFLYSARADDAYSLYLESTDPTTIEALYDRAGSSDRRAQVTLLTGEAMLAGGLYLRFVRRPSPARLSLSLRPSRCALAYRF